MQKPGIFVLAGPTAVGKGTVVHRLQAAYPQLAVSISATTRPPRPGEVDGVDYFFVDELQFDRLLNDGDLLEWALVHGKYRYGTPKSWVLDQQKAGRVVLLELDLDGARQVRRTLQGGRSVFLVPPSWEELERRLIGRGTESSEEQQRRLQTAKVELAAAAEFDVTVTNDNIDTTVQELATLLGLDYY